MNFLRSLDWRVLFAVPALSVLLGVVNNLRVSEEQRVLWSGALREGTSTEIATTNVKRGAWMTDFETVTNMAASAHVPVVVVVTLNGCGHCSRLHKALTGAAVKSWQKKRDWYFVLVEKNKCLPAYELVRNTPSINKDAPYVGVYWTRPDGTKTMKNFPGRQGKMGVKKEKTLSLEWMLAVEAAVPGAPGIENGVAAASIVQEAKIHIDTAIDQKGGAAGRVRMIPRVDFVREGQTVTLMAEPGQGSVFAGWRYPDGHFVYEKSQLAVGTHFLEGTYTAIFRRPENCAAPVLQLPKEEVVWTEGRREELKLRVNENAYPVSFSCEGLPPGMRLSSRLEGIILGRPETNGVWQVEVMADGVSRDQPTATGSFTVRVEPL